jgi:hypothetical protein
MNGRINKLRSRYRKMLVITFMLSATAGFGQRIVLGATSTIWPTPGEQGAPLQWNAVTFGGGLFSGSHSGSPCGVFKNCYGFNGKDWQFNMTDLNYCKNTCTYNATGPVVLSVTTLPNGAVTEHVSATLQGTYVDGRGVTHADVLGYFNSFTNPATDGITEMAGGGITIVLADN